MNNYGLVPIVLLFSLLTSCASGITPLTSHNSARSLASGKTQINTNVSPEPYVSATVGVTDRLDVGVDLSAIPSLHSRYTFLERSDDWAFAQTVGVFYGDIDAANINRTHASGIYLGLLTSWESAHSKAGFSGEIRYLNTQYRDFIADNSTAWFSTSDANWYVNSNNAAAIIDSNDLEHIIQVNAVFNLKMRSHSTLSIGALCHLNISEDNPSIPSGACGPLIGISFARK